MKKILLTSALAFAATLTNVQAAEDNMGFYEKAKNKFTFDAEKICRKGNVFTLTFSCRSFEGRPFSGDVTSLLSKNNKVTPEQVKTLQSVTFAMCDMVCSNNTKFKGEWQQSGAYTKAKANGIVDASGKFAEGKDAKGYLQGVSANLAGKAKAPGAIQTMTTVLVGKAMDFIEGRLNKPAAAAAVLAEPAPAEAAR